MPGTLAAPAHAPHVAPDAIGIPARYLDGHSADPREVRVHITGGRVVVSARREVDADTAVADRQLRNEPVCGVSISEPVDGTPRFLEFADGALCEVADQAALRAMLVRNGLAREPRSWWGRSRASWLTTPVLAAIVALLIVGLYLLGYSGRQWG